MMQIQFLSDYFHLRHNRQFEDTLQEGYFGIILYLSVQEQEKANSVFNDLRRVSLHASCAHRTQCAGAYVLFACLNWRFVCFIHCRRRIKESSVRCWCVTRFFRRKHGAWVLILAFPRLLFECFKLFWMFKLAWLKIISFHMMTAAACQLSTEASFRLASASRLRLARGPYNHHPAFHPPTLATALLSSSKDQHSVTSNCEQHTETIMTVYVCIYTKIIKCNINQKWLFSPKNNHKVKNIYYKDIIIFRLNSILNIFSIDMSQNDKVI